jgi:hypothetical protein
MSGEPRGGEMGSCRIERRGERSLLEDDDDRELGLKMDRLEILESLWLVRDFVGAVSWRGETGG